MKKRLFVSFLVFFLIILLGFWIYEIIIGSSYVWDTVVLLVLLVAVYNYKERLDLHAFHFFLFGIFLVFHNFGVFGLYDSYYFGIEFDTYVHFYFGLVSMLILNRTYDKWIKLDDKRLKYFALVTLILGMSALHEILEYAGGVLLGEGMGFLKAGTSDIEMWDTQTDMRNNLFGGMVVLFYYWIRWNLIKK